MKLVNERIAVAAGRRAADLAVCGAKVFNTFTGEFVSGDVLVVRGHIAAVLPAGTHDAAAPALQSAERVEGAGMYLVPGFIDAHVHMESSLLCPEEFTALLAASGVTSVVADPHELCNVMGIAGLEYMISATENTPAQVFFMLPSCVPASVLEEGAHRLSAADLRPWFGHPRVLGLGEMMNYPGVLGEAPDVMEKLASVQEWNGEKCGFQSGLLIDGHAPCVRGRDLQAYIASGIASDHEASTPEEAAERLAAGMGLMLREGSSVKNLLDLLAGVTRETSRQCMLCTDDRHVADLVREGGINSCVRKLVADGRMPLADILRTASHNTARHFNLRDRGAIAPGMRADFALYPDLTEWNPVTVWSEGRKVAENGKPFGAMSKSGADSLRGSVRLAENLSVDILHVRDEGKPVKVMGAIPRQILTRKLEMHLPARDGFLQADPVLDVAKVAVFERHRGTGRAGVGFVQGMGLRRGALASTVSHDSHNLIVMGMNDADMLLAVETLRRSGGGQTACADGQVLGLLPLPLAGLFSDSPAAGVLKAQEELHAAAATLGAAEGIDPFMTLAFLSLAVIPSLKLTDKGLVDVDSFAYVPLS